MARITTKIDLIETSHMQYQKLLALVNAIPLKSIYNEFTFNVEGKKEAHWKRDKNVRDVIVHLYEWHQLLLNWIDANMAGNNKPFLPAPYNWKTYGDMNVQFWKKHQETTFEEAIKAFKESHNAVKLAIDKFSDDELFIKGVYKWTGGSTLGAYCVSATASHYVWAMTKLKLFIASF